MKKVERRRFTVKIQKLHLSIIDELVEMCLYKNRQTFAEFALSDFLLSKTYNYPLPKHFKKFSNDEYKTAEEITINAMKGQYSELSKYRIQHGVRLVFIINLAIDKYISKNEERIINNERIMNLLTN